MREFFPILLFSTLSVAWSAVMAGAEPMKPGDDISITFSILNEQAEAATRFDQGDQVRFVIELANTTDRPMQTTYTAPGYEITVYAEGASESLWQSHAEMGFIQMLQDFEIAAGETRRLTHDWDLSDMEGTPLPPGRYEARASLNIGLIGELKSLIFTIQ